MNIHNTEIMAIWATPSPIKVHADPADFKTRGLHWSLVLSTLQELLVKDIEHMAATSNAIDKADLIDEVKAHFTDINNAVAGACANAAERIVADRYDGCRPGPMHRSQP